MYKCVIHGSYRKHFDLIKQAHSIFTQAGIEVVAPNFSQVTSEKDGFTFLEGQEKTDPRIIELLFLRDLKKVGQDGFCYFVNPGGYIGRSTSYELGIAQITNTPCFYLEKLVDHPAYIHRNSVWKPEDLATYINETSSLPKPKVSRNEKLINKLWQDLMVPGSVVAVGGVIEYLPRRSVREKEVLLVKTHKWGGRYSLVGGGVRRNERLDQALLREIREETGLKAQIGRHLVTFDQIINSGYYKSSINHIFVDNIVSVDSKKVVLNGEAEDHIWTPPSTALKQLDIEPNAKHTLQMYVGIN